MEELIKAGGAKHIQLPALPSAGNTWHLGQAISRWRRRGVSNLSHPRVQVASRQSIMPLRWRYPGASPTLSNGHHRA